MENLSTPPVASSPTTAVCLSFVPNSMFALVPAVIASCCYVAAVVLLIRHISETKAPRQVLLFAWAGILMQGGYVAMNVQAVGGFNFGFFDTAALVSWIVALLIVVAAITKPVLKLGVAIFPLAALMLGLDVAFGTHERPLSTQGWPMTLHILTSIIAFALMNIAALQALLLAFQDQQLKSHPPKRFAQTLPSLQAMESLLFQILSAGVLFLSVSLMTGFVFVEDLFAQHLAHKTVLSILAWFLFVGLLLGRRRYGWRGQTALFWTLSGFVLLLLAYFGSKFVLELILRR